MSNQKILSLSSPITELKGIGPKKAEAFARLRIEEIGDVLSLYPRSYQDFRNPRLITELVDGEKALVTARVLLVQRGKGYGRKRTMHLLVEDSSSRMEVLFFMAGYMQNAFTVGEEYHFFGKVKVENLRVTMFHPDFSKADSEEKGILPVYPLSAGLSQKDLRKLSEKAVSLLDELDETLPESIVREANVCSNAFALKQIHYPESDEDYKQAKYRLVYEELFDLKLALQLSKNRGGEESRGIVINSGKAETFVKSLPYELTDAQKRALSDILSDMRSDKAMNRLLQGDVGSGKTAVAEAAIAEAVFAGYQALFMAPTEILAAQHFANLTRDFAPLGIKAELLTSSLSASERRAVLERLASGETDLAVGTHALISADVEYNNVGLVITDEQHRFGVSQREKLSAKAANPDILVMTATPIPRTLALVLYADLSISVIDEMPPGRKEIKTLSFTEKQRRDAYKILIGEIEKGHQAYIVAPFIEDSESIDARSAETLYNAFIKKHPEISCALLHGGIGQKEKDDIMKAFYSGEISVLISTVVIEVGIDVPNATVMLIENSERFGLAQMHQLRGRVGRGSLDSYCLICSGTESEISRERARILCESSSGFDIAEKDLEIRGPGEFFGFRQHGLPQLVLADPVRHADIAQKAGKDAAVLLGEDPVLQQPENAVLRGVISEKYLNADNLTI